MPKLVLSSDSTKNLKALTFKLIIAYKADKYILKCNTIILICA